MDHPSRTHTESAPHHNRRHALLLAAVGAMATTAAHAQASAGSLDGRRFEGEAEIESPKYGKLMWRGIVRSDYLNATAMMVREGKAPLENWVVAAVPRRISSHHPQLPARRTQMTITSVYHPGMRELQDRFDTRRLADRLDERVGRSSFRDDDRAFIEGCAMFFLATADPQGRPDCSYKGGNPGFVRVVGPDTLEFPSYDGNGQFRSLGNVRANPAVGLLFIDFESPRRLRVNGHASVLEDPATLARHHGAQLVVRVRAERIFPNCPRYIHHSASADLSPDVPRPGHEPPLAAWKANPAYADVLPPAWG